jgi:spore coat protein CotH
MSSLSVVGRLLVGGITLLFLPVMAAVLAVTVCVSGIVQVIHYITGGKI